MSFNNNPGRAEYTVAINGQTDFDFIFKIYQDSDIKVYHIPVGGSSTLLTLNSDYTVIIDGDNGGKVVLSLLVDINDGLTIVRDLPITRNVDYITGGSLTADTLDFDQNYQTYLVSDNKARTERAIRVDNGDQNIDTELPPFVAGEYFRWNEDENDKKIVTDNSLQEAVDNAKASATSSQLKAWDSEAHEKTSESWAVEENPNLTKTYTSDGSGGFISTDNSLKSSKSYSEDSKASADSIDTNNFVRNDTQQDLTNNFNFNYPVAAIDNNDSNFYTKNGGLTPVNFGGQPPAMFINVNNYLSPTTQYQNTMGIDTTATSFVVRSSGAIIEVSNGIPDGMSFLPDILIMTATEFKFLGMEILRDAGTILGSVGHVTLSNGLIVQWGDVSGVMSGDIVFDISFPTVCTSVTANSSTQNTLVTVSGITTSKFVWDTYTNTTHSATSGTYMAIGY